MPEPRAGQPFKALRDDVPMDLADQGFVEACFSTTGRFPVEKAPTFGGKPGLIPAG